MKRHLLAVAERIHQRLFRTPMSEEMRTFVGNLGIFGLATLITGVILFIVNVLAGRILGPDEYGKYALVVSLGQFFIIPMNFGLTTAIVKYTSSKKDIDPIIRTGAIAIFLLTFVSVIIAFILRPILQSVLAINQTVFIFTLAYSVALVMKYLAESVLRGLHAFKKQSILEVISTLIIAGAFTMLWKFFGVESFSLYIVAILIGFSTYALVLFWHERRRFLPFRLERPVLKLLFMYGLFSIIGSVAGFLLGNIDRLMIHWYLNDAQVGIYSAYASASVAILGQLMLIFLNVFFPAVARATDHRAIHRKFLRIYLVASIPLFFISALIIWLVISLFGSNYPLQWSLIWIFALNAVIYVGSTIQWWLIASTGVGGAKYTSTNGIVAGVLNIGLNFIFIRWFGITGAVIATILASCYFFLMTEVYFSRYYVKQQ